VPSEPPAERNIEPPDQHAVLAAAYEIIDTRGAGITSTALWLLSRSLLSIAEHAMPDSYFASDPGCQLARAVSAAILGEAEDGYFGDTCGDCVDGRCHWGGATSAQSAELARDGVDYEHPAIGSCGCARHTNSVAARAFSRDTFEETVLAWQAAKDNGEVIAIHDDAGHVWVSRRPDPAMHPDRVRVGADLDAGTVAAVHAITDLAGEDGVSTPALCTLLVEAGTCTDTAAALTLVKDMVNAGRLVLVGGWRGRAYSPHAHRRF
jgi:hypothetical protein